MRDLRLKAESLELKAYLWVAPAALAIGAFTLFPLAAAFWASLHRRMPTFGIDDWVGVGNYLHLLGNPRFLQSLATTLYVTAVSVALELAVGMLIALFLWQDFKGHAWVLGLSLMPWIIPTPVSAKIWEWGLNPQFGIINHLLTRLGMIREPVAWLASPSWAIHAAILAETWKTAPFMALLLLAGLRNIPENLYRAAQVDGAGPWRTFTQVTWPSLRPMVMVAVLFRALDSIRVFDVLYVMTGGGPANTTETLSIYAYKVLFLRLEFGYGAAIGMAMFALACTITAAFSLAQRGFPPSGGKGHLGNHG